MAPKSTYGEDITLYLDHLIEELRHHVSEESSFIDLVKDKDETVKVKKITSNIAPFSGQVLFTDANSQLHLTLTNGIVKNIKKSGDTDDLIIFIFQTLKNEIKSHHGRVPKPIHESQKLSEIILEPAELYLIINNPNIAYDFLQILISRGRPYLCITTKDPRKICKKYNFDKEHVCWLAKKDFEGFKSIKSTNLSKVMSVVKSFFKEHTAEDDLPIILLDGLEKLTVYNEFKEVRKFYENLHDLVTITPGSNILIPVNKHAFFKGDLARLKKESNVLYGKELKVE